MLDWPASALLQMGGGLLPVASFIWLGLFVCFAIRTREQAEVSSWRFMGSLSLSVSVLLTVSLLLLSWAPIPHAQDMGMAMFFLTPYHALESVPLGLSLLAGLLLLQQGDQRVAAH